MANAPRDTNNIPTKIAVLNSDYSTVSLLKANPSTGGLKISDGVGGTYSGDSIAKRDQNNIPCMMAVSSADSSVLVALAVDSNGALLVKST